MEITCLCHSLTTLLWTESSQENNNCHQRPGSPHRVSTTGCSQANHLLEEGRQGGEGQQKVRTWFCTSISYHQNELLLSACEVMGSPRSLHAQASPHCHASFSPTNLSSSLTPLLASSLPPQDSSSCCCHWHQMFWKLQMTPIKYIWVLWRLCHIS